MIFNLQLEVWLRNGCFKITEHLSIQEVALIGICSLAYMHSYSLSPLINFSLFLSVYMSNYLSQLQMLWSSFPGLCSKSWISTANARRKEGSPLYIIKTARCVKYQDFFCNFIKKRPCQRCFPANFAKFLRTPFLQNSFGPLHLDKAIGMVISNLEHGRTNSLR